MTSSHTSATMATPSPEALSEAAPRPSFASFWKKTKQRLSGNRVEFVRSGKKASHSSECEFSVSALG